MIVVRADDDELVSQLRIAAGQDRATIAYNETFMGLRLSAYHFG